MFLIDNNLAVTLFIKFFLFILYESQFMSEQLLGIIFNWISNKNWSLHTFISPFIEVKASL